MPIAFTPTCSSTHVPGYDKKYGRFDAMESLMIQCDAHFCFIDEVKALGIDEIYCLSVNDAFVMRQVRLYVHLCRFIVS
jgi:thioredoxin-dependent peroxiredoxin